MKQSIYTTIIYTSIYLFMIMYKIYNFYKYYRKINITNIDPLVELDVSPEIQLKYERYEKQLKKPEIEDFITELDNQFKNWDNNNKGDKK